MSCVPQPSRARALLAPFLPQHPPCSHSVLVLQEVFLSQVLIDLTCSRSAGSFPSPGAHRPSQGRRWLRRGRTAGSGAGTAETSREQHGPGQVLTLSPVLSPLPPGSTGPTVRQDTTGMCCSISLSRMAALGSSNSLFMHGQHPGTPHSSPVHPQVSSPTQHSPAGQQWDLRALCWGGPGSHSGPALSHPPCKCRSHHQ